MFPALIFCSRFFSGNAGEKRKKFHSSINLKEEGRTLVCSWLKAPWVPCWWSASPGSWPPTSSASSVDFWHVKVIQVCQSQHGWMQPSQSSGTRHLVVRLRPIMTFPSPWWLPGAWGPQGQRDGIRQQLDWSHCHFQGRVSKQFIKQNEKITAKSPPWFTRVSGLKLLFTVFSKIAIKHEKKLSSLDIQRWWSHQTSVICLHPRMWPSLTAQSLSSVPRPRRPLYAPWSSYAPCSQRKAKTRQKD